MDTVTIDGVQIHRASIEKLGYKLVEPEKKSTVWKPEPGKECWSYSFIDPTVINFMWTNAVANLARYSLGLIWKTKEEGEAWIAKQQATVRVERRVKELNDGWEPDWSDLGEEKHIILYKHDDRRFICLPPYILQGNDLYLQSQDLAQTLIVEHEDDLKLIFGIK